MYPADLLEAYRAWVRCRQDEWQNNVNITARFAAAADAIRVHPYWWRLPDAQAVRHAAMELRSLALLPVGQERAQVQPYPSALDSESWSHLEACRRAGPYPELAAALDAAGRWSRLPDDERLAAIADVEQFGFVGNDMRYEQMFSADGEELTEQGVTELITEMGPGLLTVGLPLRVTVLSDPFDRNGPWGVDYVLDINGERCRIWSAAEAREQPYQLWYLATIRPLITITRLLERAGIPERLFTDAAGGNEGMVYLMRPEASEIIYEGGLAPVPRQ